MVLNREDSIPRIEYGYLLLAQACCSTCARDYLIEIRYIKPIAALHGSRFHLLTHHTTSTSSTLSFSSARAGRFWPRSRT